MRMHWKFEVLLYHQDTMHYLTTLRDKDIFSNSEFSTPNNYGKRVTVKAIVKDEKGRFAFVTNQVHKLCLLAGGGAESNNLEEEIKRECLEEIFYEVEVIKEIGRIREFRDRDAKEYETICFLVKTIKETREDLRTDDEKNNNLSVVWFDSNEARKILAEQVVKVKAGEIDFYNTAFNVVRDQLFFEAVYGKKDD